MESFRVVSAFMRAPVTLTHKQRVTRLYRSSLRLLDSWAEGDRGTFLEGGAYIRGLFDANKNLDPEGGCVLRAAPVLASRHVLVFAPSFYSRFPLPRPPPFFSLPQPHKAPRAGGGGKAGGAQSLGHVHGAVHARRQQVHAQRAAAAGGNFPGRHPARVQLCEQGREWDTSAYERAARGHEDSSRRFHDQKRKGA